MDQKTDSGLPVQKNDGSDLIRNWAALIYYAEGVKHRASGRGDKKVESVIQFEDLDPEQAQKWMYKATSYAFMLGKLNHKIAPKVNEKESYKERMENIETLSAIIRAFMPKLKTTKPSLFPVEELAHWIMDGRTK